MNFYNENDPKAAAWIRELIKRGLIPDGAVDERSILELKPEDLHGFIQCHFFCGIAGWPLALRLAGWPEDKEVWTGSAPCQPLSCAGLQRGHADERHLWPAFYNLIAQCRPAVVLGEQVASKDGLEWFAGVRADLEGAGYACGGANMPVGSIGAPHRRYRLWWCAYRTGVALGHTKHAERRTEYGIDREAHGRDGLGRSGVAGSMAHANGWQSGDGGVQRGGEHGLEQEDGGARVGLADTLGARLEGQRGDERVGHQSRRLGTHETGSIAEGGESGDSARVGPVANTQRNGGRTDEQGRPSEGREADGWTRGVDDAAGSRCDGQIEGAEGYPRNQARMRVPGTRSGSGDSTMDDALSDGRGARGHDDGQHERILADAAGEPRAVGNADRAGQHEHSERNGDAQEPELEASRGPNSGRSNPWDRFDIIPCRDGKARRIERGTFPLVNGLSRGVVPSCDISVAHAQATAEGRMMRLRGYGNAICPQLAAKFILAAEEARAEALTSKPSTPP